MKKIYTRCFGGIGNQLFQYAAAAYCQENEDEIVVDWRQERCDGKRSAYRRLSLGDTGAAFRICNRLEKAISNILKKRIIDRLYCADHGVGLLANRPEDRVIGLGGIGILLDGYWQDWRIPYAIIDRMQNELNRGSRLGLATVNKDLEGTVLERTVSVHVRRTDYSELHRNGRGFGLCGNGYYKESIELISRQIPGAVFVVFSDDRNEARKLFNEIRVDAYFVEEGCRLSDIEELRLMSLCAHQIVANSSFSWWGAFLNRNEKKVVIAPSPWDNNQGAKDSILPPKWIKVKR